MTRDMIHALSDTELSEVLAWGHEEDASRIERRKHDAIAKIRELATAVNVSVTINGRRGRPPIQPEHNRRRRERSRKDASLK